MARSQPQHRFAVPVCITADIEFEIRGALGRPATCAPVGEDSMLRTVQGGCGGLEALVRPLVQHSLPATFFVEVMQSLYFGLGPMQRVLERAAASQLIDFQMHLHPCWRYLAEDNWRQTVAAVKDKHDSMAGLGVHGAKEFLSQGIDLFKKLTGKSPVAFRSGSLKVDLDLMRAQAEVGIRLSSCVGHAYSPAADPGLALWSGIERFGAVTEVPVTSYLFTLGRWARPKLLTVTGTTLFTIRRILQDAWERQAGPVVLLTHASEMAVDVEDISSPPRYAAHRENQERWRGLCAYLDANRDRYQVMPLGAAVDYWESRPAVSHFPYRSSVYDLAAFGAGQMRSLLGGYFRNAADMYGNRPADS